jgi:hypothetical protein
VVVRGTKKGHHHLIIVVVTVVVIHLLGVTGWFSTVRRAGKSDAPCNKK